MSEQVIRSLADLEQIKTAYNENTAAHPFQVLVCSGAGCVSSNCADVRNAVAEELEKIGMKDKVLLRETGCIGTCARAIVTRPTSPCRSAPAGTVIRSPPFGA